MGIRVRADIVQSQRRLAELRAAQAIEEAKLLENCRVAMLIGVELIPGALPYRPDTEPPSSLAGTDGGNIRGVN